MFIETHTDGVTLTFIKSKNVQVFPSGRRGIVVNDNNTNTIPFDPEARLNTEANNRKQSGLSGYTQEYLKDWNNEHLIISLAGYLFDINLATGYTDKDAFGNAIITALAKGNDATAIYANILIEDVPLYSGEPKDYFTSILRNQSASDKPEPYLDLQNTAKDDYYFSGLSFSTTPLTSKASGDAYEPKTRDSLPHKRTDGNDAVNQQIVSLRILEKVGSTWQIHEPARLPKIEHGATKDSIVVTGDALMKSKLIVHNDTEEGALAELDSAAIFDTLTAHNNTNDAKIATDTLEVNGAHIAKGTIDATADLGDANNIEAKKAKITNLTGTNAAIENINSSDIQQKVGEDYCDVPVIFLTRVDSEYQLRITRVNMK